MGEAPTPPLLCCARVELGHTDAAGARRVLVRECSFTLEAGTILVVVGASGSGKTTLLRLLNRFDDLTAGEVRLRGAPLASYEPRALRRQVVLVAQRPVMFQGSVDDNLLALPPEVAAPSAERRRAVLGAVGLAPAFAARTAAELSGGEQQRVAIARALLMEPSVLLLDEPTSALDPRAAAQLGELLLRSSAEQHLAVVVVTHHAELVRQLGAQSLLLDQGAAVLDPGPERLERFLAGA